MTKKMTKKAQREREKKEALRDRLKDMLRGAVGDFAMPDTESEDAGPLSSEAWRRGFRALARGDPPRSGT